MSSRRFYLATVIAPCFALGCGINYVGDTTSLRTDAGPEVDAGPQVDAGEDHDAGVDPNAYPAGPYGGGVGDTISNMRFHGYVNDHPDEGPVEDGEYLEDYTLQDIRELGDYDYLLINVAAEWCSGCRIEAQRLGGLYTPWANRRGYLMSVITQDDSGASAQRRHLERWVASYPINYTMVFDPDDAIYDQVGPESLPLNLIIDLRTMEILHRVIGEDFGVFNTFESLLPGE